MHQRPDVRPGLHTRTEHAEPTGVRNGERVHGHRAARGRAQRGHRHTVHDGHRSVPPPPPLPRTPDPGAGARDPQRHEHADGLRALRREVGKRSRRGPPSDLLPRKPVGAEVDSFEARVDADGERRATHANERAIVAKIPRARSEAREDAAETVEFAPPSTQTQRPAAHRSAAARASRTSPLSVATQR